MKTRIPCVVLLAVMAATPLAMAAAPVHPDDYDHPVRVACVGDSITQGSGAAPGRAYPAQLQDLFDLNWEVRNFGVGGRTLLRKGDHPYWNETAYREALAYRPDVVVIMLGTNDTKPQNWVHRDEFVSDYADLVNSFRRVSSRPRVFICRPCPVPEPGNFGITEAGVQEQLVLLDGLARDLDLGIIDIYDALADHPELLPDRVHPNTEGAGRMAAAVYTALTGNPPPVPGSLTTLNSYFRDHAVLPRDVAFPVWGSAPDGTGVTVGFAGQWVSTLARDGLWSVTLQPLEASRQPRKMTLKIRGGDPVVLRDLVVGDVWLASGQSNMERQLGLRSGQQPLEGWREEAASADYPLIRRYYLPQRASAEPVADGNGAWSVCSPESAADFSAVAYYFARDLHRETGIPVGILESTWGGTRAEAWTRAEALALLTDERPPYAEVVAAWYQDHEPDAVAYSAPGLDVADWTPADLPASFDALNLADYDGVVWFRREVELTAAQAEQEAVLHLGAIDDIDTTWVNGREVGGGTSWNEERSYRVPAGTLEAGINTLAIRVVDTRGTGGFAATPETFTLGFEESDLPLAGVWSVRATTDFAQVDEAFPRPPGSAANRDSRLYNAMIAPLTPLPIKGVIWYQGESNNDSARAYRDLFPLLIQDWRQVWDRPALPFLYVQIAPHQGMSPELREAQLLTLDRLEHTAMVVTTDVGDALDIHPTRKEPVGQRLALAARALAYQEDLAFSGPLFRSLDVQGSRATVSFTHIGGGLVAQGGALTGFTIAGIDGSFVPAHAEIHGDRVMVWSDQVASPVAVRYGWANVPEVNLANRAGLPASPFRTDVE